MSITRRSFLKAGGISAFVLGLTLVSQPKAYGQETDITVSDETPSTFEFQTGHNEIPFEAKSDRVYQFTPETFKPYVGGSFTLQDDLGTRFVATLVAVEDTRTESQKKENAGECFTLSFSAPAQKHAERQRIYTIEHGALGEFSLFLVPMEKDGEFIYSATVNHVVK